MDKVQKYNSFNTNTPSSESCRKRLVLYTRGLSVLQLATVFISVCWKSLLFCISVPYDVGNTEVRGQSLHPSDPSQRAMPDSTIFHN
jgi:hypothetical protein